MSVNIEMKRENTRVDERNSITEVKGRSLHSIWVPRVLDDVSCNISRKRHEIEGDRELKNDYC